MATTSPTWRFAIFLLKGKLNFWKLWQIHTAFISENHPGLGHTRLMILEEYQEKETWPISSDHFTSAPGNNRAYYEPGTTSLFAAVITLRIAKHLYNHFLSLFSQEFWARTTSFHLKLFLNRQYIHLVQNSEGTDGYSIKTNERIP